MSNRSMARTRERCLLAGQIIAALGIVGSSSSAIAATVVVNRCNDESGIQYFGRDLREALAAAVAGDTVDLSGLSCSTITLTHGEIPVLADGVTIQGPTDHVLTVDGQGTSRIFSVTDFGVYSLSLADLRLYRGNAIGTTSYFSGGLGGCVFAYAALYLTRVELSGCQANIGGGAYANIVSLTNSTITGNSAIADESKYSGSGGGIAGKHVYATSTTVSGNSAKLGGGLFGGSVTVGSFSVITGNTASADGGGIYGRYGPIVVSSSITNNHAGGKGGGLFGGGQTEINKAFVGDNTSGSSGGGVYVYGFGKLSGSTISLNTSGSSGGGGVFAYGGIDIRSSTIDGNVAAGMTLSSTGGGVKVQSYGAGSNVSITNSTISGNQAFVTGGVDIRVAQYSVNLTADTIAFNSTVGGTVSGVSVVACQFSLFSSILAKNTPVDFALIQDCGYEIVPPPQFGQNLVMHTATPVAGSIAADPQLAPLANNGGDVCTHALSPLSPAIDAGTPAVASFFDYDSRGVGFARLAGPVVDIGAFERQPLEDQLFLDGFE